jgi:hypothetical protein
MSQPEACFLTHNINAGTVTAIKNVGSCSWYPESTFEL